MNPLLDSFCKAMERTLTRVTDGYCMDFQIFLQLEYTHG
jgi:hypothetical protein